MGRSGLWGEVLVKIGRILTPNQNNPIGSKADSIQAKYRRPSGDERSILLLILPGFSIPFEEAR